MERFSTRRTVFVFGLAITPIAGLGWLGCSDDEPKGATMLSVDPGGTFGAEVSVSVVGRGRVTGAIPGSIDCPTNCYVRYTFTDASKAQGTNGIGLKAQATDDARFLGWSFETVPVSTKGKGPDSCNPVTRDSTEPSVDPSAAEITLPYGETAGTSPEGQQGACGGNFATVPLAYHVVARFEDTRIPDAGVEAEAGDGGIPGEIVFEPTQPGSVAKGIGFASSYLYWKWEIGSIHGISYGYPGSPSSAETIASPGTSITQFEVDQYNVVYQTATKALYAIQGGGTSSTPMSSGSSYTCTGVASDFSGVFCRTAGPNGSLVGWSTSGTGPVLYQTGLPNGTDLVVDSSYFYIPNNAPSSAGGLDYVSRSTTSDAGSGSWNPILTSRSNMRQLEQSSSRFAWIEYDTGFGTGSAWVNSNTFSSSVSQIQAATAGLQHLAIDSSSSTTIWLATANTIFRASTSGTAAVPFKTGLTNVGGIAVDSSYVYWTQSDGRVYRESKF